MDPDANLAEQLRLTRNMRAILDRCDADGQIRADERTTFEGDAARLAELVEALNGWIAGGGFLPQAWRRGRS